MASLSRKERRALQAMYGPQKPWAYQKEMARRRQEAALLRDLVTLCQKHGLDLDSVKKNVMSVTESDPDLF
jgi:hypothetical protein